MTILRPDQIPPNARIIDVRNPDEFLQEHIPNSQNIPLEQLNEDRVPLAQSPDQHNSQPIVLTCRTGRRAADALNHLTAKGYTGLTLLEGGLKGWKAAGLPTQSLKKGYTIMQQVQIIVGIMILTGFLFKPLWFFAPVAGLGMLIAGLTNTCLMATILSKMPWNQLPTKPSQNCPLS